MRSPWAKAKSTDQIATAAPDAPGPVMYGNGLHLPIYPARVPEILETLRATDLPENDGIFCVDWAGIRTRIAMLPWAPMRFAGTTRTRIPVPSDGYRSEAEEYVGLAISLINEKETYRIVEVGAGWAPWAVMGIVLARRQGKRASGIAVEADPLRATWCLQHAADNGVQAELIRGTPAEIVTALAASAAELQVVQAAGWATLTTLRFPVLDEDDMGGAVNESKSPEMDYRGAHLEHFDVPTVTLNSLLGNDDSTDLLHIDLQGMELEVILPGTELIESKVRFMAVGTHNRYVEGQLQEHLLKREWALLMESPSTAVFDGVRPTLTGFTTQDGNQLWANSRFRDTPPVIYRDRS